MEVIAGHRSGRTIRSIESEFLIPTARLPTASAAQHSAARGHSGVAKELTEALPHRVTLASAEISAVQKAPAKRPRSVSAAKVSSNTISARVTARLEEFKMAARHDSRVTTALGA